MRAAALIGCQVYDADGQRLGTVHDLHFSLQPQADGNLACRLDALECGGIGLGHRLGYGEGAMRGPWPFPQLFRRLARRSLVIPWSQITAVRRPRIDTSARRDQLKPARSAKQ
jgi:sporulation protein YlmC with PRC-barrel domain